MNLPRLAPLALVALATAHAAPPTAEPAGNPVATALQFSHLYAAPAALTPGKDRRLKVKLTTTLAAGPELPWDAASGFFDKDVFQAVAGDGTAIPLATMDRLVREKTPQSRKDMNSKPRLHADLLSTQFDLIEEGHRGPAEELVAWLVKNYQADKPLGVIIICTRNTRRSVLGATMGNVAASYYGLTGIRFYSGGTDPDAFNPRSIATLREIGIDIEATGQEAPRGSSGNPNPVYRVQWGKGLETREFSKKYADAHNPQSGFAAILVCSEADAACPKVAGASARIPVPYLDPKAFDGAAFEAGKYAERRDDVGRFMLSVMMQARRRLELNGRLK
jgi:arsenate reductase